MLGDYPVTSGLQNGLLMNLGSLQGGSNPLSAPNPIVSNGPFIKSSPVEKSPLTLVRPGPACQTGLVLPPHHQLFLSPGGVDNRPGAGGEGPVEGPAREYAGLDAQSLEAAHVLANLADGHGYDVIKIHV